MTKATLREETKRRLRERDAEGAVYFSDDDIDTALDEGYDELSDQTEWNETSVDVELLASRPYYDLQTILGDDLLAPGRAFNRQTSRWLIPTSYRDMDTHDRRWEEVVAGGQPDRMIRRSLRWMGYWPRSSSDGDLIKQYFTALPAVLADDDAPGFPERFHLGLVAYALADLWSQDGEITFSAEAWQEYEAVEKELRIWVTQRLDLMTVHGMGPGGPTV